VFVVVATAIICKRRANRGILNPENVPLFDRSPAWCSSSPETSDFTTTDSHVYVDLD